MWESNRGYTYQINGQFRFQNLISLLKKSVFHGLFARVSSSLILSVAIYSLLK